MPPTLHELLDLVFRWVHVIAGVMWIGNSLLFNWLDRQLYLPENPKPGLIGEMWMVHSGGFYQVEKKFLQPKEMPKTLHWFKWQAYTTWLTGFMLLGLVYYHPGGGASLVDAAPGALSHGAAVGVGLGAIFGSYVVYEGIWRSPLAKMDRVASALCIVLLLGEIYWLTHTLSGRAAYIHVGAILGTVMVGNVLHHIIPSQRELVKATLEGREQDPKLSWRAKQRSIQNGYLHFPVIFIMVSNHFPDTYGNGLNWIILAVLMFGGATSRWVMNARFNWQPWIPALAGTILLSLGVAFFLMNHTESSASAALAPVPGEKVSYTEVRIVMKQRCLPCHSKTPTDDVYKTAPNGITFDDPANVKMYAERIKSRAVISKTMPLGNKTGMTQDERDLLARWFLSGAPVN